METNCKYCATPLSYDGDLDENGKPFCGCIESEFARKEEALEHIAKRSREIIRFTNKKGWINEWMQAREGLADINLIAEKALEER